VSVLICVIRKIKTTTKMKVLLGVGLILMVHLNIIMMVMIIKIHFKLKLCNFNNRIIVKPTINEDKKRLLMKKEKRRGKEIVSHSLT
jgi:hypothetical protein